MQTIWQEILFSMYGPLLKLIGRVDVSGCVLIHFWQIANGLSHLPLKYAFTIFLPDTKQLSL